jgi:predicted dehydrogenase
MHLTTPLLTRRRFIQAGLCTTLATALHGQQIIGANNRVRIALIGCGGRGHSLIKQFTIIPGVELVAICDADTAQMALVAANLGQDDIKVDQVQDYREVYDRSDIDAVVIATPNFWHALQATQAMEAGKHVYVEKPVSFTLWEGLQLEAAETKYGKVISAGYQNRSDKGPSAGIQYVKEGHLGKIKKVRSLCFRNRNSIGKIEQPLAMPATLDHNLWLGPVQDHEIVRPKLHYDWHWDFRTGNGDLGNQGVHEIDMVCWLLGDPQLPTQVNTFGNRFAWDDAGNTPNMLSVWFQMGGADVILETNDLKMSPDRNVASNRMGTRVGIIAECENGILKGGRGGMMAMENDGRTVIQKFPGDGGKSHQRKFIDAIRNNAPSMVGSRIRDAHKSASLAELGNISYQLGELVSNTEALQSVGANEDLHEILSDQQKQLAAWGINDLQYYMGKTLDIDPASNTLKTLGVNPALTGPHYRKGFELKPLV